LTTRKATLHENAEAIFTKLATQAEQRWGKDSFEELLSVLKNTAEALAKVANNAPAHDEPPAFHW
jgi:histone H3/H4